MDYVLVGILVVAALAFVLYPLRKGFDGEGPGNESRETLTSKETAVISLLSELEMDFEMGNISQGQYEEFKDKFQKQLDALAFLPRSENDEVNAEL